MLNRKIGASVRQNHDSRTEVLAVDYQIKCKKDTASVSSIKYIQELVASFLKSQPLVMNGKSF